jgi:hypothetical protein
LRVSKPGGHYLWLGFLTRPNMVLTMDME